MTTQGYSALRLDHAFETVSKSLKRIKPKALAGASLLGSNNQPLVWARDNHNQGKGLPSMKPIARGIELSKNKKIGPSSATYAAQPSCPKDCPLRNNGCYGEAGRVGITTRRLNDAAQESTALEVAQAESRQIDSLSGLMDLRLHVVGDCSTNETAKIVAASAMRFMKRKRKTKAWTYNHAWKDVDRSSWGEVSVLASVHTIEDARKAFERGYAVARTVAVMPEKPYREGGILWVPCIEQQRGDRTCVECRLCMNDQILRKKGIGILFAIHTSTKKAKAALGY